MKNFVIDKDWAGCKTALKIFGFGHVPFQTNITTISSNSRRPSGSIHLRQANVALDRAATTEVESAETSSCHGK